MNRSAAWVRDHGLSLTLIALFLFTMAGQTLSGHRVFNEHAIEHGEAMQTTLAYMAGSQFWFESLQNWQSEFLSLAAMVVLSVYLRQRGSPESKPLAAPHSHTGID